MTDGLCATPFLYGVVSANLDEWLPRISHLIERLTSRSSGRYEVDDIAKMLRAQEMQLWVVLDPQPVAIVLTQIINYPRRKVLNYWGVSGSGYKRWLHLGSHIDAWAREQGCTLVETVARPGWLRAEHAPRAFTHVVLERGI